MGQFGPVIKVINEAVVRKQFKAMGNAGKELTKANKSVAKTVLELVQSAGGTKQQQSAIAAISARATQSAAALQITDAKVPYAVGAFMGAEQYPQFPEWVGNTWDLTQGTGPYVFRDVFASSLDRIKNEYRNAIVDVFEANGISMDSLEGD